MSRRRVTIIALLVSAAFAQDRSMDMSEDDLRKAAVRKVDPEYPAVARQIRITGEVDLRIGVDETGTVDRVDVVRGNTLLVGASTQAVRKWKFNPFHANGQAVRASGPIRFVFQL